MKTKILKQSKKGQMAGMAGIVLTFLVIVIVISVAGEVQTGVSDSINDTVTYSQANTTIQPVNNINTTLERPNQINSTFLVGVFNNQTSENLGRAEYHLTEATGEFQLLNTSLNNTVLNISYDYSETARNTKFNISQSGLTGIVNISSRLGLLGTLLIISLVIGLLIAVFQVRGGGV